MQATFCAHSGPVTTTPDPAKKAGEPDTLDFRPFHDALARHLIQSFAKDGAVFSNILFVQLARPIARQPMAARSQPLDPRMTHEFMSTRQGRERLGQFLRSVLTAGTPERQSISRAIGFEPDVIVHMDEAWAARTHDMQEATNITPSQHQDRQEVVMIAIHHRWGGTITGTLPIINLPQRHVKFQSLPDGLIATLGPMAMTPDTRA